MFNIFYDLGLFWSSVQCHESKKLPKNVINKEPVGLQAELEAVLDYIVGDIEAEDETAFQKAQNEFDQFLKCNRLYECVHIYKELEMQSVHFWSNVVNA